jgi:hypothetical protein
MDVFKVHEQVIEDYRAGIERRYSSRTSARSCDPNDDDLG